MATLDSILTAEAGLACGRRTARVFLALFSHAVQIDSNRKLCLLLDAVLKTKSKSTLRHIFMDPSLAVTGLHMLVSMLLKCQSQYLMTPSVRKGLRTLHYLIKRGVVQWKSIGACTSHFCPVAMVKVLFDLTKHEDQQVRDLAAAFQQFRFDMPREQDQSHRAICERARERAARRQRQELEGLEEGEVPAD